MVFINFKGTSLLKVHEKASNKEVENLDITLFTMRTNIYRLVLTSVTFLTKTGNKGISLLKVQETSRVFEPLSIELGTPNHKHVLFSPRGRF